MLVGATEMLIAEKRYIRKHLDTCRLFRISMRANGIYVVVEDNALIKQFLETAIKSSGREVVMFDNTQDAQAYINEQGSAKITCCIVDVVMANGNGERFVEWIATDHQEIPVVVYTQHEERGRQIRDKFPVIGCLIRGNGIGNGEMDRVKGCLAIKT